MLKYWYAHLNIRPRNGTGCIENDFKILKIVYYTANDRKKLALEENDERLFIEILNLYQVLNSSNY